MTARASRYFSSLVFLLVLGMAAGCTKAPNDAQITSDVQSKINADSGLQGKQLGVQSENGTVTLSGTVDNDTPARGGRPLRLCRPRGQAGGE